MPEKLPQSLRQRLVPLFKEILAYGWVTDLSFNRLSGAVYHELLRPEHRRLSEDATVNLAVNLTRKERLQDILQRYDAAVSQRKEQAGRQVQGIVKNMIDQDTADRENRIADTLTMLKKFPLVRSITGIRKLVQARISNGHRDVAEDDFMFLT